MTDCYNFSQWKRLFLCVHEVGLVTEGQAGMLEAHPTSRNTLEGYKKCPVVQC